MPAVRHFMTPAVFFLFVFQFASAPARAASANNIPLVHIRADMPVTFGSLQSSGCTLGSDTVTEEPQEETAFAGSLALPDVRRVVVFVPGYATSIAVAFGVARHIQHVLGPADRVVLVDWGSTGHVIGYSRDLRVASRNAPMLATALLRLKQMSPALELDVFSYSLGARIVALAIPGLSRTTETVVSNAVLAAPDMSVLDYERAIARKPKALGHVTLYVSERDHALLLSEIVHFQRRLGQITHWSQRFADTDVVDASVENGGTDGHGYAVTVSEVVVDIGQSLAGDTIPHERWTKASGPWSSRWIFTPSKDSTVLPIDDCAGTLATIEPPAREPPSSLLGIGHSSQP
jgi:hypothetical protein